MKNLIKVTFAILAIVMVSSCEKEEIDTPQLNENSEPFLSETGNSDKTDIEEVSEEVEPILHLSFPPGTSDNEIKEKTKEALARYYKNNQNRAATDWTYEIRTKTGTGTYDGTDGSVKAKVVFKTNKSYYNYTYYLNNPGNDREPGYTDVYVFTVYTGTSHNWVELVNASISLKGTDGWRPTGFYVFMYPNIQKNYGTDGYTYILSQPNQILDNTTSTGWDTYYTGNVGDGRLNL